VVQKYEIVDNYFLQISMKCFFDCFSVWLLTKFPIFVHIEKHTEKTIEFIHL